MYSLIWRLLPGPAWLKAAEAVLLLVVVLWALMTWVFPAIEPLLPFDEIHVGEE